VSITAEQAKLMKLAANTIRDLQLKNTKLEDSYTKLSFALDISLNFLKQGKIAAEDFEDYIKEAAKKDISELSMIKEASSYNSSNFDTFSVSNKNELDEESPDLIGFLLSN
jgi:hypothetical protein